MPSYTAKGKHERYFAQRSYSYESATTNETEDQWRNRIAKEWSLDFQRNNNSKNVKSILWAFHDSDIEPETGNPKGLHAHAVVEMELHCGIAQELAKKYFNCSSDANCQVLRSRAGLVEAYAYLTHTSRKAINDGKTQYDPSVVHIEVDDEVKKEYNGLPRGLTQYYYDMRMKKNEKEPDGRLERQQSAITTYQTAILRGQITADQAFDMVENDDAEEGFTVAHALKNQKSFEQSETAFLRRFKDVCTGRDWVKTLIYIYGAGGEGKTTLSRQFANRHCNSRGVHIASAKGRQTTFDFADGYKGQVVTLANEVKGEFFNIEQFCDIMDPKYATIANSRNTDKFFAPNYVIMNNSITLEQFIFDTCYDDFAQLTYYGGGDRGKVVSRSYANKDKIRQVRRRFAVYCVIENNELTVYYRTNAHNPTEFFYDGYKNLPYDSGKEPFIKVGSVPFDPNDFNVLDECVDLIDDAIGEYYEVNGFSVNPLNSGWDVMNADNTFGDLVILPNARDDIVSIEKHPVIYFNQEQYEIADFNDIMRTAVDFLEFIADYLVANPQVEPYKTRIYNMLQAYSQSIGQFVKLDKCFLKYTWLLQFFGQLNKIFYNSRILKYLIKDIKDKFMDQRTKLMSIDAWIKYKGSSKNSNRKKFTSANGNQPTSNTPTNNSPSVGNPPASNTPTNNSPSVGNPPASNTPTNNSPSVISLKSINRKTDYIYRKTDYIYHVYDPRSDYSVCNRFKKIYPFAH